MFSQFVDIFRQIGQFLKGLDKENKMTLISLRIAHFQGHQSQKKKLIRDILVQVNDTLNDH